MKRFLFLLCLLFSLSGCGGSEPASGDGANSSYNPEIHTLEKIEGLDGSKTLVLASIDSQVSPSLKTLNNAVSSSCDELGHIQGGLYYQIATQGNLKPCFSEVRRWSSNIIYGKYRPQDDTADVWFITDDEGKVHHLPKAPKKSNGFKNGSLIKKFAGAPAYLDSLSRLVKFDYESGEEIPIINHAVGHFVTLTRNDGDHVFFTNLIGGQRRKPDGVIERLDKLDLRKFFFEDASGDLGYLAHNGYFKRIMVDSTGEIIDDASSGVPVAYNEWINNPQVGSIPPTGPYFIGSMEGSKRSGNLIIHGGKGFMLGGKEKDLREIGWCDFGHCGWPGGFDVVQNCINSNYIYFYAPKKLTQISRNLQNFEHILENMSYDEQIIGLSCLANGNLLVKTLGQTAYVFDPQNKTKTILPGKIQSFIR